MSATGPLRNLKVVELQGLGPGPFCAMMLADMGADVVRIDRADAVDRADSPARQYDVFGRNKRSIAINLKQPEGVATALRLIDAADAVIDPFRPGVVERLGLGPAVCLARNPRLVFGRMTGWGQTGPLARIAGHDLNYIALSGALHSIGRPGEPPVPPLNLVGDFGGGALYLAFGMMAALLEARDSGRGQIVDAAMVDGSAHLMTGIYAYLQSGRWSRERGRNFLDSGAPFYDSYETADGKYVAIAAIEPQFYAELLARLELSADDLPPQMERSGWDDMRSRFAARFLTRTRDEWCRVFDGSDACFAPVLDLDEAPHHPQNVAREVFVAFEGVLQPAPAPRLSRTPAALRTGAPEPGRDSRQVLTEWGFASGDIENALEFGAVRQAG